MIPYLEFHYGSSTSYRISNPEAEEILNHQSIEILTSLVLNKNQTESYYTMHFPTEDVITISHLTKTIDEFDRDNIDNHTVILKTSDYLHACPPINLIKPIFQKVKTNV